MEKLHSYKNGNYLVNIYSDGTKERILENLPAIPEFPESIDVKCTNVCDANCRFCHESSVFNGEHAEEKEELYRIFENLPAGTELAIGGGNPASWPSLHYFLNKMKEQGIICNMTMNSVHIRRYQNDLEYFLEQKKIYGLGISYFPTMINDCHKFMQKISQPENVIFHLIMGVHTINDLSKLIEKFGKVKVLLLGYKQYGRGESFSGKNVEAIKYEWFTNIHKFFNTNGLIMSFDNLGIQQMKMKRFFSEEKWKEFYMGNDGEFTFFMDLVKRQYCKSSTTKERFDIAGKSAKDMFQHIRSIYADKK